MSGFNLRKRARVSYYEPEEPPFDEFIYCIECRDYVYEYCSIHGPLLVIPDDKVPAVTGLPAFVPRAALTIPSVFLHIAYSRIPEAGLGVFSTLTLPAGVRFGPYRGARLASAPDSGYGWQIFDRNNKPLHVVDAADANNSNWMRYVNCSRHQAEQNLVAFQYQGQLYYRTVKVVPRFTELLVFYGSEFANRLGVDLRRYSGPCPCPDCQAAHAAKLSAITKKRQVPNERKKENQTKNDRLVNQVQEPSTSRMSPMNVDLQAAHTAKLSAKTKKRQVQSEKKKENQTKKRITKDRVIKQVQEPSTSRMSPMNVDLQAAHAAKLSAKTKKRQVQNEQKTEITKAKLINQVQEPSTSRMSPMNVDLQEVPPENTVSYATPKMAPNTIHFDCNFCRKTFDIKPELEKHIQTHMLIIKSKEHNVEKNLKCKKCGSTFSTKLSLLEHAKSKHGLKYYVCSECEYVTNYNNNLRDHLRTHTGERPFKCGQCSAAFAQSTHLQIHQRTHTGEKPYKCGQCSAAFAQSTSLQIHQRTHTGKKPYKCGQCSAAFAHSTSLQNHQRTHTGEKPYKCGQCSAAFAHSTSLQIHQRTHTGKKPYKCGQCSAAFAHSTSLQIHQRTHTGKKPYKCGQCSAAFAHSTSLQNHQRTHTGEKPYKCGQCNAAFARRSSLQSHQRTHTGEEFECNICDYKTTHTSALKSHLMARHSGQKPYGCELCSYRGATRSYLTQHMKTHRKA